MRPLPARLRLRGSKLPEMAWLGPRPFDLDHWREPVNRTAVKPRGGLWLAPSTPYGSDWAAYLEDGAPPSEPYYFSDVSIAADAEFLVVDTLDDFYFLLKRYRAAVPEEELAVLRFAGLNEAFLDFEAIREEWSGVYLTEAGQKATRYPDREKGILSVPSLYGWDFESLLVLRKEAVAEVSEPFLWPFFTEEDYEEMYADRV